VSISGLLGGSAACVCTVMYSPPFTLGASAFALLSNCGSPASPLFNSSNDMHYVALILPISADREAKPHPIGDSTDNNRKIRPPTGIVV